MPELTSDEKEAIIKRRGSKSGKTGIKHPISNFVIHHRNRNPKDNAPQNLIVLTIKEHKDLHKRAKK